MSSAGFTGRQRLALLAAFALLVVLRLPQAWWQGRFLDEEGNIFLAFAWHRPALAALFRSFGGYLNLAANGATLVAAKLARAGVPLELAPYVTMTTALLFQLVPALLILTGRAPWLRRRWAMIASLLVIVIAPRTEEVFANTLHIQFHLALAAALILTLEPPRGWAGRIGYGLILFLAPLCGPAAIVLLPLFGLRAVIERDPARLAQTVTLGLGAALQLLVFFTPSPVRGGFLDPPTLAAIAGVRLVALPLAGSALANKAGGAVHAAWASGGLGWWSAAGVAVAGLGALALWASRDRRDGAMWLIAAGLGIAAVSFGGGMIATAPREWFSVGAGERYNFLPLALLGLALVALAARDDQRARIAQALLVLVLAVGAITYPTPIRELSQGPAWRDDVAAWRRDHDHPLRSWPESWRVDLSDRDRPCTGDAKSDPSYCESVWLARVTPR